jgi:hypothetical protein
MLVHDRHHLCAILRAFGQENVTDAIAAGRRQPEVKRCAEELVGYLHQDAGAITSLGVCAYRTTMVQSLEYFEALLHDFVAFTVFDIGDKANPARIALIGWIVEPLLVR